MSIDITLFSVLFYMAKFFGVLPVSRNPHNGKAHGPNSDCFNWCMWGGLASMIQLCTLLFFTYSLAPDTIEISNLYLYLWLQSSLSATIPVTLSLCTRPKVIAKCVSEACRIYHLPTLPVKPLSLKLFIALMIYPFVTLSYLAYYAPSMSFPVIWIFFQHDYLYIPLATVEIVFACFCFIAERAFTDINAKMKQLQRKALSTSSFDSFKELMESHVSTCEYVRCLSELFSSHLLASFVFYTLRMVIYSVSCINVIKSQDNLSKTFAYAFIASYLTLRLFFVCHWTQKLKMKGRVFVSYMRYCRIIWVENITTEQGFLLDAYEDLIESSAVDFTACGLFPINVQQILSIIGLIITYAIVALQ